MGAFTEIKNDDDFQKKEIHQEVIDSINERNSAYNASWSTAILSGFGGGYDAQSYDYWHTLQTYAESLAVLFVDEDTSPEGESLPPHRTIAEARAKAGISEDGFKRVPIGNPRPSDWKGSTGFSYGLAERGDICGPWLLYEVQKLLCTCKKVYSPFGNTVYQNGTQLIISSDPTETLAEHAGRWSGGSSALVTYTSIGVVDENAPDEGHYVSAKESGYCGWGFLTQLTGTYELWIKPYTFNAALYYDIDGLFTGNNKLQSFESGNLGVSSPMSASSAILPTFPGSCPAQVIYDAGYTDEESRGVESVYYYPIIEYAFTYDSVV